MRLQDCPCAWINVCRLFFCVCACACVCVCACARVCVSVCVCDDTFVTRYHSTAESYSSVSVEFTPRLPLIISSTVSQTPAISCCFNENNIRTTLTTIHHFK